jgi:hypothetical protein
LRLEGFVAIREHESDSTTRIGGGELGPIDGDGDLS